MVAIILALSVPSAGHSWNSAGGSPLRHLTAIAPLAMLPIADLLGRQRGGRALWIIAGLLALFSLHNAWTYNAHHLKFMGPMADTSVSGWKTLLLFPRVFAVEPATRKLFQPSALLWVWVAATIGLTLGPLVAKRSGRMERWLRRSRSSWRSRPGS